MLIGRFGVSQKGFGGQLVEHLADFFSANESEPANRKTDFQTELVD
jgi:hypothetical protein